MPTEKEDRLSIKLTTVNAAGAVTASSEVNDLSKLDACILQEELAEALVRAIRKQKEMLSVK